MFLPLALTIAEEHTLSNTDDDYEDKVYRCVQALLILGQERTPIKKSDLNRMVFPSGVHYRLVAAVTSLANKKLHKIFGMRLFEVEDKTKYLLVNSEMDISQYFDDEKVVQRELVVLYFMLMGIFVSPDERMTIEEIEKSIRQPLCLSSETIKEYLDLFTKKLYLKQEKHQEIKLYGWGERAIAEIDPENFFQCFLNLTEDASDKAWPELRNRIENLNQIRMA